METFQIESCVRGHHIIYKELWEPVIREELKCQQEPENPSDAYAITVTSVELWLVTCLEDFHGFVR